MSRVALVTGGTRGIGHAIVAQLKKDGYKVAAGYSGNDEAAHATAKELDIMVVKGNVGRFEDCKRAVDEVQAKLGPVEILVNNAGITRDGFFHKMSHEQWSEVIRVNMDSCFNMTRQVIEGMRTRGWGRIINIASAHGLVASAQKSAYVAAKHGIAGLTKTVALEVAEQGITMNAIAPGYTWTPLLEKQIPENAKLRGISEEQLINDVFLHAQPTRKFVQVGDLAALAVFLASDAAASITGTIIPMDGGWTAH